MGVEELRAALEEEGRARVATLLREGESEAARVREAAEAAAARRRAERLAREEAVLRREARARIDTARREAQRLVLEARESFLERVFERVAEALARALEAPESQSWLVARAWEALAYLPEGAVRVKASPGVAPLLAAALAEREGLRVESDASLPAGFRASGAGGALVVDATVPTLIALQRTALAIEVLRRREKAEAPRAEGGV